MSHERVQVEDSLAGEVCHPDAAHQTFLLQGLEHFPARLHRLPLGLLLFLPLLRSLASLGHFGRGWRRSDWTVEENQVEVLQFHGCVGVDVLWSAVLMFLSMSGVLYTL